MKRITAWLFVGVVLATGLSGCGGGSSTGTVASSTRFELVMPVDGVPQAVHDTKTGLVWQRYVATRNDLAGPLGKVKWHWARDQCIMNRTGDHGGWRLPEIHELTSLQSTGEIRFELPAGHPFVLPEGLNWREIAFWSATESARHIFGLTLRDLADNPLQPVEKPKNLAWAVGFGYLDLPRSVIKFEDTVYFSQGDPAEIRVGLFALCVRDHF